MDRQQVLPGMHVVDAEGGKQGTVKEVRAEDFKIDRSLAPDVYVRFSDVEALSGDTIKLKLSPGRLDDQSWMEGPPAPKKS